MEFLEMLINTLVEGESQPERCSGQKLDTGRYEKKGRRERSPNNP